MAVVQTTLFCGVFKFHGNRLELGMDLLVMRLCGLWDSERWRGWQRAAYALSTLWMVWLVACLTLTNAVALTLPMDLISYAACTCLFLEAASGLFKALAFLPNRARLRGLLARLDALIAGPMAARGGGPAAKELALAGRASLAATCVFLSGGFTTCMSWFLHPAIAGAGLACWAEPAVANATAEPCPEPLLPAIAWFPFDVRSNPGYGLAYASLVGGIYYTYISTCIIDLLYVSLMMYFAALLHVLSEVLGGLRPGGGGGSGAVSDADAALVDCVQAYAEIDRCAQELQSLMSTPVMVQFAASGMVICMSLFSVSAGGADLAATVKFFLYLLEMYLELLLYCWFGDDVIQKGEAVAAAAYACRWYDGSNAFRRGTLLTLMRAQRPISFRGGVFYALSRATFLSITQASYSFFNLLRSVGG